jgi:hypothetical protein
VDDTGHDRLTALKVTLEAPIYVVDLIMAAGSS